MDHPGRSDVRDPDVGRLVFRVPGDQRMAESWQHDLRDDRARVLLNLHCRLHAGICNHHRRNRAWLDELVAFVVSEPF